MASERNSSLRFSNENASLNSTPNAVHQDFVEPSTNITSGHVGMAPELPSFLNEVLEAKTNRYLSSEGTEFVNKLIEALKKKDIKCEILPRTNTYLFHNGKASIGIIFEEHTVANSNMKPKTRTFQEAYKEADERFRQYPIVNIVLCAKVDYERVAQYELYITRALKYGIEGAESFNIDSIANNNMFRVTCNKFAVDQLVEEMSVHKVLPHYTYGLVLEMCTDPKYRPNRYNDYNNQDDNNWVPIMVVPAYTSFVVKDSMQYGYTETKFVPQIHISEPMCLFPNIKMIPLVVSLAMQHFLVNGLWKEQFNDYSENGANIGNLWFNNETNQPERVNDKREREQFIHMHCETPTIVFDIENGRASIPGISLMSVMDNQKPFLSQFAQFFNDDSFNHFTRVVAAPFVEYTGVVNYDGKLTDARAFDYFKVIKACNNQRDLLEKFITLPYNPEDKLMALASMNFSVQSLYDTAMCILEPEVLVAITRAIGARINVLNQTTGGAYVDFSAVSYASNNLKDAISHYNGNFFTYGNGNARTGYNPFGNDSMARVWGR